MFDHIGIKVKNLKESLHFYDDVLRPLGYERNASAEDGCGYGYPGKPQLWIYVGGSGESIVHLGFAASTRQQVDQFYVAGLAAGGTSNGPPGLRADYGSNYYAAFIIDPNGNNVEAVCLKEPS